jgi:hypothetical protein
MNLLRFRGLEPDRHEVLRRHEADVLELWKAIDILRDENRALKKGVLQLSNALLELGRILQIPKPPGQL